MGKIQTENGHHMIVREGFGYPLYIMKHGVIRDVAL